MSAPGGLPRQNVCLVFVSRMSEPGHGDAFVLVAANNADAAAFLVERLVARDFPTLAGSSWMRPESVARLYAVGSPRVLFAAMPKSAPIIFPL